MGKIGQQLNSVVTIIPCLLPEKIFWNGFGASKPDMSIANLCVIKKKAFLYTSPLRFHRGSSQASDRDKGSHVKQSYIHKCQQLLTPRSNKFPMKLVLYQILHQLGLVILIYFLKSEFSCPGSQLIYKNVSFCRH